MENSGKINGVPVTVTNHALKRMVEMGMTPEEIRDLIANPEERYESKKYPGSFGHKSGKFCLAIKPKGNRLMVVTAIYSSVQDWLDATISGDYTGDRHFRFDTGGRMRR